MSVYSRGAPGAPFKPFKITNSGAGGGEIADIFQADIVTIIVDIQSGLLRIFRDENPCW